MAGLLNIEKNTDDNAMGYAFQLQNEATNDTHKRDLCRVVSARLKVLFLSASGSGRSFSGYILGMLVQTH